MRLKASHFEFTFPRPAMVMGIVNVTPDSFSDGGRFLEPQAAIEHGVKLVLDGADIIDVGGESTRPRSKPVEEAEELRRVVPVIEGLAGRVQVPISIDTRKPGVAKACLKAGASIINDVGASREDADLWRIVADSGAGYVCMHMQGNPETMQDNPVYVDAVKEVERFFELKLERMSGCGVRRDQIILDPGIGFGKKIEHNLELLGSLREFAHLARPLLLGVSRKSFLGRVGGGQPDQRLAAGLACACWALAAGIQIIRTHDVLETVEAVRMTEALAARQRE